ncbi:MAG TPA: carbon storage regulator CsrA [Solirubrobacteraceae bacterium]|jgi:carbon storage regulator
MLILTRRPGERVVIGEDVLVTVMEISGQTVRLGIAAPQGLPIYREEIWLAVKEENRAAAEAPADALPDGRATDGGATDGGASDSGTGESSSAAPAGEGEQQAR